LGCFEAELTVKNRSPLPVPLEREVSYMSATHLLRHPLTVLLVGTLLSLILFPVGASVLSAQRTTREARQNLVTRILDYDTATRQDLLSLHTRLYVFDENMRAFAPTPEERRPLQAKVYEAALAQYLAFDNGAWTTPQQIINEILVRELVPKTKISAIKQDFAEYHADMWNARNAIHALWMACLSANYTPGDPAILALHDEANKQRKTLEEKGSALLIDAAKNIQ
jgi:hypothetical protein